MKLVHGSGLWAIRLLLISLAITPFARALDWNGLLLVRRNVGVAAACYAVLHLALYIVDQNFRLLTVASEIALRFYLTIGFGALLVMLALAWTSTDAWMKRLGQTWKRLHRLAYPVGAVALLHFFLQAKLNVSQPVFLSGVFLWLMLWRLQPEAWRRRQGLGFNAMLYAGLALGATELTGLVEFAWYGLATKVEPVRVLLANESIAHGLRPAHWVLVVSLAVGSAIIARRSIRAATPRRRAVA
jgi:sulfoxide reductase heme-binding subunit YedZ